MTTFTASAASVKIMQITKVKKKLWGVSSKISKLKIKVHTNMNAKQLQWQKSENDSSKKKQNLCYVE